MNPRPRLKEPDKSAEVPHQKMERHSHIAAYSRSRPCDIEPWRPQLPARWGRHFWGRVFDPCF